MLITHVHNMSTEEERERQEQERREQEERERQEREEREKLKVWDTSSHLISNTHTLTPSPPLHTPSSHTHTPHKDQEEARFIEETTKLNIFLNAKRDELETWKTNEWQKKQVRP